MFIFLQKKITTMMIVAKYNILYNISHDVNEQKSTSLHKWIIIIT